MANNTTEEALRERTCELECVCRLSRVIESSETLNALLEVAAGIVPAAWYHSECISCVITWKDMCYASHPEKADDVLSKGMLFVLHNFSESCGEMRILCQDESSGYTAAPLFTREKEALLRMVADQLGYAAERFCARQTIASQQRQLVQADKLVAMGTLAAGVAHEINNPTCFIMLNAPMLEEMWASTAKLLEQYCRDNHIQKIGKFDSLVLLKAFPTLLAGIHKGARRIKHIVREMKEFVRGDDPSMDVPVNMNRILCSAEALLQNKLKNATSNYHSTLYESLPAVLGNFQRLEQVVINLIMNACEALSDEKQGISVQTYVDAEGFVCLSVTDEGTGISEEDFRHIFDPFFTTKRNIGGTGLGLAIANNIVAEHNGHLKYQSVPGQGTCVILRLPACPKGDN